MANKCSSDSTLMRQLADLFFHRSVLTSAYQSLADVRGPKQPYHIAYEIDVCPYTKAC